MSLSKGYIQVYTGDGKGKTTAALGLALRAAGAGLTIYIAQFIKSGDYSEITALLRFSERIRVEQFGRGRFVKGNPEAADVDAARNGLAAVRKALESGAYHLVVMDEANVAATLGLFSVEDLMAVMDRSPDAVELVITGRGADPRVVARADLVTEMRAVKHYYPDGVSARVGIEK